MSLQYGLADLRIVENVSKDDNALDLQAGVSAEEQPQVKVIELEMIAQLAIFAASSIHPKLHSQDTEESITI